MKAFRYIAGIFLIGVFLGIVYAGLNKAQSSEVFPPDLLRVQSVPVYCGNSFEVLVTTMNTFKMELLGSANVTVQGQPDGRLLGTMSYGIDWVFDTEILLDVVNSSLANVSKLPDIEVE